MKIANDSHHRVAWIVSSLRRRELSATLVVKGTYRLRPDEPAERAEEGDRPTGDLPVEGGPEGSLYYGSDMAPLKLKTDLLLVGSCYAPGGRPVTAAPVEFHVGSFRKRLVVVGDRFWRRNKLWVNDSTDPVPFLRMSLGYENAFGGEGFAKNPIGKGIGKRKLEDGSLVECLPNVEDAERLIRDSSPNQNPSGFGPIPDTWPQRARNLGSFSAQYMKERWPWYPADFDFAYYNAAPLDQRLDSPLRGDEVLRFVNMHPDHSDYTARLPGDRPQLFIRDLLPDGSAYRSLREVALRLDTLWVDMDAQKLVLVWRGHAVVRDIKMRDVAEIHVVAGTLGDPPLAADSYQADIERKEVELKEAEEAEALEEEAEDAAGKAERKALQLEMDQLKVQYDRQANERLLEARSNLREQGLDDSALDMPVKALLKEADLDETLGYIKAYAPSQFAALMPLIPQLLAMELPAGDAERVEENGWTRDRVEARLKDGGDFTDQDLSGLDLSGLTFDRACFKNAVLSKANASGCGMSRADMTGASFSEADLTGAVLSDAICTECDFSNARLDECDLSGAVLDSAIFVKASMKKARLERAKGKVTDFSEADLTEANLRENGLRQPDFRACVLERADFSNAIMPDATIEEARGAGVVMAGADVAGLRAGRAPDLSNGDFRGIKAEKSQWETARLDGARFHEANLRRANFSSASLRNVRFDSADMSGAILEEALLENSILISANLFRASFERATLRRTDLRRANLFEVEFWNTVLEDALFEGANLKMTKLAGS